MKLRNKKTTNIKVLAEIVPCNHVEYGLIAVKTDQGVTWYYRSLAELNEEWEDYEEPKGYWYIRGDDSSIGFSPIGNCEVAKRRKEIGNYFETKEQAEKAVERLKAWKRLKDKGARIIDYACYGGTNTKGEFSGEIKVTIDAPCEVDKYLLSLLFGGEE